MLMMLNLLFAVTLLLALLFLNSTEKYRNNFVKAWYNYILNLLFKYIQI